MKKAISLVLSVLLLTGCTVSKGPAAAPEQSVSTGTSQMKTLSDALPEGGLTDSCRSAYEIFVYSFADSNGDGIGDLILFCRF